jgi:fucose permease
MEQKTVITEEQSRSFPFHWQIGLAFFAFILIGAQDGAVGVLIPSIREYYGVNKAIVSLLLLCTSAGYLMAAFNSGLLVQKLGQRRFLLLGTGALMLGALSISTVPAFVLLAFPFFLIGFGIATLDTGLNTYIAGLPQSTARLNYLHAFYGAGALLGPIIASTILVVGFTWNNVYSVWIVLGLFFFLGVVLAFKKSDAVSESHLEIETRNKRSSMAIVLRLPVTWIVAFFLLFYVGVEISLGTWMYSFLTEQRQQSALFSAWTVSGYWMGLTLGRIFLAKIVGWLSERTAIQICVIGAMFGILLTWLIPIGIVSAISLCLTGFCLGPIFPTTIALMPQYFSNTNLRSVGQFPKRETQPPSRITCVRLIPLNVGRHNRLLATAIGLVASLGGLGGVFFPWLSGNLAQVFGLWVILPLAVALTMAMLVLWMILQWQPFKKSE